MSSVLKTLCLLTFAIKVHHCIISVGVHDLYSSVCIVDNVQKCGSNRCITKKDLLCVCYECFTVHVHADMHWHVTEM